MAAEALDLLEAPDWLAELEAVVAADVALADRKAALRDVSQLIRQGRHEEAVTRVAEVFDIDMSRVAEIRIDASAPGSGEINRERVLTLNSGAFASPQWLASTIGHEVEVHLNGQLMEGRSGSPPGSLGEAVSEVEAYDYELQNATRFGLTPQQVEMARQERKAYFDQLATYGSVGLAYQQRVDQGDYSVAPEDGAVMPPAPAAP